MLDLGFLLRQKYFQRLNGVITSDSKTVKVYDSARVPNNAVEPYILLGAFNSSEIGQGSKDQYAQECTFLVEVVTKFGNAYGGKKQADLIAEQITPLIRTRTPGYLDLSPDFQMLVTQVESTQTQEIQVPDGVVVRRFLRFRHKIFQLTNNN